MVVKTLDVLKILDVKFKARMLFKIMDVMLKAWMLLFEILDVEVKCLDVS